MSNFANPEDDTYAKRIILASGSEDEPSIVFASDLTKGMYLNGDGEIVLSGTAPSSDGASKALDNLLNTAVNVDIIPGSYNDLNLGNDGSPWRNITAGNSLRLINDGKLVLDTNTTNYIWHNSGANSLLIQADSTISMLVADVEMITANPPSNANETAMILYDFNHGSAVRVTVGAADSGGTGFRVLRIPN